MRGKLVGKLPITGELLRGSLLERTVRHTKDCPKCARGEGHRVFVLTVSYPGGRTRQFSVRRERVAEVARWLSNYQELKEAIEAVCVNSISDLLRPEHDASKARRKQHGLRCVGPSAQLWRRVDRRGSERSSRKLDGPRRCGAGGRSCRCGRVRGLGETTSQEPLPGTSRRAGRHGVAIVDPQATFATGAMRCWEPRGARQFGVPGLHACGRRQDA